MKNVSLVATVLGGKHSWRLLDEVGKPIPAFDGFAKSLERRSINTRKNYCRWLAEFFDYLYEAALGCDTELTQDKLIDIFESYDSYLVLGCDSGNEIARLVDQSMPSPRIATNSSALKHAALRSFLRLSERVRQQLLELTHIAVAPTKLFPAVGESRNIAIYERQRIMARSMIAGVISAGPKLLQEAILPVAAVDNNYDHDMAFPFDRFIDVAAELKTYRDVALYAFCAASGCRISEAAQLLWSDIDTKKQQVFLVDPATRPNDPSYLALTTAERDKLVWKGRDTSLTLLIEPFVSMFFNSLAEYLRREYLPHGRHMFVFQYLNGSNAGQPYFLVAASSRNAVLKGAMKRAGVHNVKGPHSLRHMYGTYLLNYFPRPNGGFGLPPTMVQRVMGHAELKSTMKYAKFDRELIEAELAHANQIVFGTGTPKSLIELKKAALIARVAELERQLTNSYGGVVK